MKRVWQRVMVWGLIFALSLTCLPGICETVRAEVHSGSCGDSRDSVLWELDTETGKLVIRGEGEIPNYSLLDQPWRSYRDLITEAVVEPGITAVGQGAFKKCGNLRSISLPQSVRKIRMDTFSGCSALETIELNGNTQFGMEEDCLYENLSDGRKKLLFCIERKEGEFEILDSFAEIEPYAFCGSYLSKATIPGGIYAVAERCFYDANQLEEVVLNFGTRKIESQAFYGDGLQSIWIPRSVTSIADDAFRTGSLDSLTIYGYPGSAAEVYAKKKNIRFEQRPDDMDIVRVTFDANGGEVSESSKSLYPMMTYGELPVPVRSGFTFAGWYTKAQEGERISSVSVMESEEPVTLYAHWTGGNVYSGTVGGNGWEYLMDTETGVLSICGQGALLPEVSFPKWTEILDAESWKDLVTEVAFGNGITSFQNIHGATQVRFSDFTNLEKVTLPESMEDIKDVFWGCDKLKDINLPGHIGILDTYAFSGCKSLVKIEVPGSVSTIMNFAFMDCDALEEVVLQEGVSEFYGGAFEGCTSLKYLYLPASFRESINGFMGVSPEQIEIASENPYFQTDGKVIYSKDGTKLIAVVSKPGGEYVVPDNVMELADYAFSGCNEMTKISLPDGITEIPYDCFIYCSGLKEVKLPQNLVKIGKRGFDTCESLERLDLSDSVTEIADDGIYRDVIIGCSKESAAYEYARQFGMQYDLSDTEPGELLFDACGGTVSPASKTVTKGSSFCKMPMPVREHYVFKGWYTEQDGGILVTERTVFEAGGTQTVYAHWEGEKRSIRFDANGGEIMGKSSKYIAYGEPYGSLPEAWREGYCMTGWYTDAEGGDRVTSETPSMEPGDAWLSAHWEPAVTIQVSFDPMGGKVGISSKSVVKGEPYGELPTPGRTEYVFCGWYTQAQDGVEVTSLDVAQASGTLYARWKPLHPSYEITFHANGGNVSVSSKTVTHTKTYGSLPDASRTGYRFDGWYTQAQGGTRITKDSLVAITEPQTLYAHWTANTYRVSFLPNGGTVETNEKTVTYGKPYGTLPVPKRSGYVFDGWYQMISGGTLVTAESTYQTAADQTLYAHWHEQKMADYTLGNLSYSFSNSQSGFQYPDDYRIDIKVYKMMFGDTQTAIRLYNNQGEWGGNCFGMTSTSCLMLTQDNGIYPSSFRPQASVMQELSIYDRNVSMNLTLREFIEMMQISQSFSIVPNTRAKNKGKIGDMCQAVKATGITGYPVLLSLRGNWGGHSVAAYKYEELGGGMSRIYVYDPSYPKQERYVTVKQMSEDVYGLSYYVNNMLPVTDYSYYPYDLYYQVWNNREYSSDYMLLSLSSDNMEVYDGTGELAAKVTEGELVTERESICELVTDGVTSDGKGTNEDGGMEIFLPLDDYTVKNTDSYDLEFEAEMFCGELSAKVVTDGSTAVFSMDDETGRNAVELPGEQGDRYEITLRSLSDADKEEISLSGIGEGDAVSVSQEDGEVNYSGDSASLAIEGEECPRIAVTATAGAGGRISNPGRREYLYRSYPEYQIAPDAGYEIADVLVDGVSVGAAARYGFAELVYPHTIEARFVKTNTQNAGAGGNIQQQPKEAAPKKTSIAGLKAKSKGFEVRWKKSKDNITGYELQYSTNSKFKKKATVTKKIKKSKTKATVKKLKAKKKYFVRIRTYRKEGKKISYSGWSKKKSIKTKK